MDVVLVVSEGRAGPWARMALLANAILVPHLEFFIEFWVLYLEPSFTFGLLTYEVIDWNGIVPNPNLLDLK